jgi:hypothetical protein
VTGLLLKARVSKGGEEVMIMHALPMPDIGPGTQWASEHCNPVNKTFLFDLALELLFEPQFPSPSSLNCN